MPLVLLIESRGNEDTGEPDTPKGVSPVRRGADGKVPATATRRPPIDFVVLCRSQAEAQTALETVRGWVEVNGLSLHPNKTRLVEASQPGGFDFLGYHFERGMKWPRPKSLKKLKETIRQKTRRSQGRSVEAICADLNGTLRGWFEYFKHSHYTAFGPIDRYIRGRLRSILRKRQGKKGFGRGLDNQRWPNAYFSALGLFSLKQAHAAARQSSGR